MTTTAQERPAAVTDDQRLEQLKEKIFSGKQLLRSMDASAHRHCIALLLGGMQYFGQMEITAALVAAYSAGSYGCGVVTRMRVRSLLQEKRQILTARRQARGA